MPQHQRVEYLDLPDLLKLPAGLEPAANSVLSLIETGKPGQLVYAPGQAGVAPRVIGSTTPDGR